MSCQSSHRTSSLLEGWLLTLRLAICDCLHSLVLWLFLPHSRVVLLFRNPCLKVDICGPDREHLGSPFILYCNDIVASETSVMLPHCIAVDLFSVQLTVVWIPTVERIRYHGYIYSASTLRSNGTVFPRNLLDRQSVTILMPEAGPFYYPQITDEEDEVWGTVSKYVTNGSKSAAMDVIGFLCVSLGSSIVQLHYILGRRRACTCSKTGFSSQNGDRAWVVY
jgi:hypothetical protein